ncbi:MAG TPA: hypothetical protein VGG25_11930 [Streptosporangiaceae bacterium]
MLWQTEKRFIPDGAAVSLVTDAATAGLADALDLGAALVLVQAGRLDLDGLEYEIFQGTHAAGMRRDALAAILGRPAAAAGTRQDRLEPRQDRLRAGPDRDLPDRAGIAAQAAARAGRRAVQAADRAAEAARRRKQLSELGLPGDSGLSDPGPGDPGLSDPGLSDPGLSGGGSRSGHAERAAARARQARQLADEAAERVTLSLIHAAAALDRYAARCAELSAGAEPDAAQLLRHRAGEYHRAAAGYREMAARGAQLADGRG